MGQAAEPWWWDAARCPRCRSDLRWDATLSRCDSCGFDVPLVNGVPVLATTADAHKAQQAAYFDDAGEEFETTRPHGTPAFYRWLIEEKFRRSIASLSPLFPGATVLSVCGGSGMDAEMLAGRGGRVLVCGPLGAGSSSRDRQGSSLWRRARRDRGRRRAAPLRGSIVRPRLCPRRAPPPRGSPCRARRDGASCQARRVRRRAGSRPCHRNRDPAACGRARRGGGERDREG